MEDPKHRLDSSPAVETETAPKETRRRLSRIVHDHKGNATVQWHDAPADYERPVFEIEGARPANPTPAKRALDTGTLAIRNDDSHDPYMRIPEAERKRGPGTRTDLRKLSSWIKMMRELEEAKKRNDDET
jgi:hypothetical protein